ncbi:flavodoxin family protein [Clostridium aminobutyricum]|uniref:NAD(P)H-dependent oxidoreductase n=1 Tax=Clostridium aminobutyricum TaxID=33953 RepID=A0A939D895_CLOAM|nr:NAD(P)H-dependent oxidoreductase [Clostridium aminobutyricum]MBN7772897.1 NAD(P)H-dependent oxidoreductase [Clostridium aminobutyricum]
MSENRAELLLIKPYCREKAKTGRLTAILEKSLEGHTFDTINTVEEFEEYDLKNKRILFAVSLGQSGINLEWYGILKKIRTSGSCFEGSIGGIIVDGNSELYTKAFARELVLSANMSGCTFVGRPLVEGTHSLDNFNIVAKNLSTDNMGAYIESGRQLIKRVMAFQPVKKEQPSVLMLHASNYETSNTLSLWNNIKQRLEVSCDIHEISLRNGEVWDCMGCQYNTCLHFGEKGRCFYGGIISEQVYPAILEADALLLVCPNYNDAVSANIAAFINRLTALFRTRRFYDKALFAIVVSGYSGSDLVAQQLIGSLNMNKSFYLPGRFTMMETANNPGTILEVENIDIRAKAFSKNILGYLKK